LAALPSLLPYLTKGDYRTYGTMNVYLPPVNVFLFTNFCHREQ